ncbi:bifunctional folylpolyglutamate synthase/dihydrofolate synthase [Bacillaceae bacterium W0354]
MNEQQAIEWIHQQIKFGIKPGLKRVEWLLKHFDHPEKKLKTIHVAGTNGKGSTVTYLRNMLQSHGYTIGTFTSPYIEQFNERMSINGDPISGEDLVKYVKDIKPLCEQLAATQLGRPTEFEIITVIAFKYFFDQQVDYAIIEVGLGGRLDSTNVIEKPLLSIITNIGYDHTDLLGETLEEIAFEKSGIIKQHRPIVTNVTQAEAVQVIEKRAREVTAPLYKINQDYSYQWHKSNKIGELFSFKSKELDIDSIQIQMSGKHQVENATLAIFSLLQLFKLEGIQMNQAKVISGVSKAFWLGRFEKISDEPTIILDGAHNVAAVETLIDTLSRRYTNDQIHILLSVVKNKPIDDMIHLLKQNFSNITLTTFDYFKSYRYDELKIISEKHHILVAKDWKKALNKYNNKLQHDDVIIITGSLYFVSEVRRDLLPINREH